MNSLFIKKDKLRENSAKAETQTCNTLNTSFYGHFKYFCALSS